MGQNNELLDGQTELNSWLQFTDKVDDIVSTVEPSISSPIDIFNADWDIK